MPITWTDEKEAPKVEDKDDTLIVDVHEPASIHDILRTHGIRFKIASLKQQCGGDYRIGNAVAERKTIYDFVASVNQGRVFDQLGEIPEDFCRWLFISGTLEELQANPRFENINTNAVYGAIGSCMTRYLANVLWSYNDGVGIPVLYKLLYKTHEGKLGIPRRGTVKKVTSSRVGDTIANLLRVEPAIAEQLVHRAKMQNKGVLKYIIETPNSELMLIGGIGNVTLKRIRELVG